MSLSPLSPLEDVWNAALRCPPETFVNLQFTSGDAARRYRQRLYSLRWRVQKINRETIAPHLPGYAASPWDDLEVHLTKNHVLVIGRHIHTPTEITIGPAHKD